MDLTNEQKLDELIDIVISVAHAVALSPTYHSYNEIPKKMNKVVEKLKSLKQSQGGSD